MSVAQDEPLDRAYDAACCAGCWSISALPVRRWRSRCCCCSPARGSRCSAPALTQRALDVAIPRTRRGAARHARGALRAGPPARVRGRVRPDAAHDVRRPAGDVRSPDADLRASAAAQHPLLRPATPSGRLMTRVTSDVETLNELFSSGVVTVFGDLFTLAAIMVMMLVIDWRLALVAFAVIPLVWLTATLFRRYVRDAFREIRLRLARLNSVPSGAPLRHARRAALRARAGDGAAVPRGKPGASGGAPAIDQGVRHIFSGYRGADRGRDRAAALVRRATDARGHVDGGRARRLHPAHPPVLPAAPGSLGEVQPAAERDGIVGTGIPSARRAGDGVRARASARVTAAGAGRGRVRRSLVPLRRGRPVGAPGRIVHRLAR